MPERIEYKDLFSPDIEKKLKSLTDQLDTLEKQMNDIADVGVKVSSSSKGTGKDFADNEKKIENLKKALSEKQKIDLEELKIQKQLQATIAKGITQKGESFQELVKEREALKSSTAALRQDIKAKNTAKGSIEKLEAETNKLVRQRKKLDLQTEKGRKEFDKLSKEINDNTNQLKKYDAQIGRSQRNVGNYKSALEGMRSVFAKFVGAAGLIAGAVAGFVAMSRQITKTAKLQDRLRFAFGSTGDELQRQSSMVRSLSTIYEQDYETIIKSANALSKEFGISGSESLTLISEGFQKGANNSGEFLDILKEYPAQLKLVGLNADQSISLITQQVKEGVFSDKGIGFFSIFLKS